MHLLVKFILVSCVIAWSHGAEETDAMTTEVPAPSVTEIVRPKRQVGQLPSVGVLYDQSHHQPAAPVTQQQTLLGLNPGSLPIIGTLVGNIPGLTGPQGGLLTGLTQPLSGLTSGLTGTLSGLTGGLNLGNLGLGNLGLLPPAATGSSVASCPLNQKLSCRCEPLTSNKIDSGGHRLQILSQSERVLEDGSRELNAKLSNGLSIYQRMGQDRLANNEMGQVTQGFYSLKISGKQYLNIYFTTNELDFSVKADVSEEPAKSD